MIGIYKITNPKGRVYVGQSVDIEKRKKEYIAGNNCKPQSKLYRSMLKYGFSTHIFEVIEECTIEELNIRERYWQEFYNVIEEGLNCRLTGTEDKSGYLSEEVKNKIGAANKGRLAGKTWTQDVIDRRKKSSTGKKRTEEFKKKLSEISKGRKHTEESKQKITKARKGTKLSDEVKEKIGLAVSKKLTGRKLSEEHKQHMSQERRLRCFNKKGYLLAINPVTGEVMYKFKNISDAKQAGFDLGSIGNSIKKGHKHKGYSWRYEKECI